MSKPTGALAFVAWGSFAFVGLGEATGANANTADHEESAHVAAALAGSGELAPGIDDLIAGLTVIDERPPAVARCVGTHERPDLIVTSPLAVTTARGADAVPTACATDNP